MPDTVPDTPQSQLDNAGGLTKALMNTLDLLVDRVLGKQTVDKDGKPLRQVAYMHMPNGLPIDPRQYRAPWTPAGNSTLQDMDKDGTLPKLEPAPAPAPGATPAAGAPATPPKPVQNPKLMAAMQSALNTAWLCDEMFMVTSDGSYKPYPSTRKLSSAYEGLIHSVQTVPPPPKSDEVVEALAQAQAVLYNLDAKGNITGTSSKYKNWMTFSQDYADAKADFAREEVEAMTDPVFGAAWPATAASAQQKVDNAYRLWRSAGADDVEKALDTVNSSGGSAAARFVSQARELLDKWNLSLAGVVAVKTPYTQMTPASWYDHTDDEIGFTALSASSEGYQASGGSQSSSFANNWYKGSSESTQAAGFGTLCGITVGGAGGSLSSNSSSEGHQGGGTSSEHEDGTTSATIELEYGVVKIERPWCLTELLHIGGWYVPGEKAGCISDGTIAGQAGDEHKLLPMIPTQALVIRNVKITAKGWGSAGKALADHYENQKGDADSSSWNAAGTVGFMCFGGAVKHEETQFAGSSSDDSNASWAFTETRKKGEATLEIRGCQIAGYIGEIVGMNPRIDDPNLGKAKPSASGADATSGGAANAGAATPAAAVAGDATSGDAAATPATPAATPAIPAAPAAGNG